MQVPDAPHSVPQLAGVDSDGDGVPDSEDNCPDHANPDQANSDRTLVETFERFGLDNWGFGYSSDGVQSGASSNGAAIWSTTLVDICRAISDLFSVRLYADSPISGGSTGPWQAIAAIDTTVDAIESLKGTVVFDQIQGMNGIGHSYFQIAVFNSSDPSKAVSYGYTASGDPPGDVNFIVSVGARVDFNLPIAEDYFNKYGTPLDSGAILRFQVAADYANTGGGRRTAEVRLDDIEVLAPDSFGDACDYCAPVWNSTVDPTACLDAIGPALDLPGAANYSIDYAGDVDAMAVSYQFGGIEPFVGEETVVICTGDVLKQDAQTGTNTDAAVLTLQMQAPPGACENDRTECNGNADCPIGDTCIKINYDVSFCYQLLTSEYPETTGGSFDDLFSVRLIDTDGTTNLVEYSGSIMTKPISPAPQDMVMGTLFELALDPQCLPDVGFAADCVNVETPNTDGGLVTLEFELANGPDGMRDTCVVIDGIQLTSLDVVDPNPDLLDGNGEIRTGADEIDEGGRDVGGAAADGVTEVLLRQEVALPGGQVRFSLDRGIAPEDGGLSLLGNNDRNQYVFACVETIGTFPNLKHVAYAVYHAPLEFNRGLASDDDADDRQVDFKTRWYPYVPCNVEPDCDLLPGIDTEAPLRLARPPVVLVHGNWSNAGTWSEFPLYADERKRDRYHVTLADYEKTNSHHFVTNRMVVYEAIQDAVKALRDQDPKYAVTQADVGAHSMGGILSRIFAGNDTTNYPYYLRRNNFKKGDIHKLVTIDTPHFGSPLADFLVAVRKLGGFTHTFLGRTYSFYPSHFIEEIYRRSKHPIHNGSLDDLRICSDALKSIPATLVPGHACIGKLLDWNAVEDAILKKITRVLKFIRYICRGKVLIDAFCNTVGCDSLVLSSVVQDWCDSGTQVAEDFFTYILDAFVAQYWLVTEHDTLVDTISQRGGIVDSATTTITELPDAIHVKNTASDNYSATLETLLNTAATGDEFGTWPPVASVCAATIAGAPIAPLSAGMRTTLAPAVNASDGVALSVYAFGPHDPFNKCPYVDGTVSYLINVYRSDEYQGSLDMIYVAGPDALSVNEDPGPGPDYSVCFDIPREFSGRYEYKVFALDQDGDHLESDVDTIVLSRMGTLRELQCVPEVVYFQASNDQRQMNIIGRFAEQYNGDLTHHDLTTYTTSNPGVVSIESDVASSRYGLLQANGPGAAVVSVAHGGACCQVLVEVADARRPIVDLEPDFEVVPGSDVELTSAVECPPGACPDAISYRWAQILGPQVELSSTTSSSTSFHVVDAGLYTMQLIVDGGYLPSLPETVSIDVREPCPSQPPEVDSVPNAGGQLVASSKNRFLSVSNPNNERGRQMTYRVTFVDLPPPYDIWNGEQLFAGDPMEKSENGASETPIPGFTSFWATPLVCDLGSAHYADWEAEYETVHFYHEGIVPGGVYDIQLIGSNCDAASESDYSDAVTIINPLWGDMVGPFDVGEQLWTAPDHSVDVATDVVSALDKFGSADSAPIKARVDLEPRAVDFKINITDITMALDAFAGASYPFSPSAPELCP